MTNLIDSYLTAGIYSEHKKDELYNTLRPTFVVVLFLDKDIIVRKQVY